MKYLTPILLLVIGFTIGWFGYAKFTNVNNDNTIVTTDTITVIDTFEAKSPKPKTIIIERVDTDTVTTIDSVRVPVLIPIEAKTYKDTNYFVKISGYKAKLDSISIYNTIKVVTNNIANPASKPPKYSLGLQVGYGIYGRYIGIGIQYNLINF